MQLYIRNSCVFVAFVLLVDKNTSNTDENFSSLK